MRAAGSGWGSPFPLGIWVSNGFIRRCGSVALVLKSRSSGILEFFLIVVDKMEAGLYKEESLIKKGISFFHNAGVGEEEPG